MKNLSIFTVEDDELYALFLKSSLESHGFINVRHIPDGIDALIEIFEEGNLPDVILMDYDLGRLSGFEAMQRIIAYKPEMKVVFITGEAKTELAIASIKSGAVDYITKDKDVIEKLIPTLTKINNELIALKQKGKVKKVFENIKQLLVLY